MKIIALTLCLLSSLSFAQEAQTLTKSDRMNNLLKENEVTAWGKRENRYGVVTCKVPRKTKELICNLRASGSDEFGVYVKFNGVKAKEISDLLKEFNISPEGKRQRQQLEVDCKLNKGTTIVHCESVEHYTWGM
jgi:hypothetical protein